MSSLRTIEKRIFEDLFDMGSGYVLDFSNATFAEFFRETINVDIYDNKYAFNGGSKAKHLRAFIEIEPDIRVGKVLSGLLEVWKYNNLRQSGKLDDPRFEEARRIAARLCGEKIEIVKEVDSEEDFLGRQYSDISFDNLKLDSGIIPVLESRLAEARKCLKHNSPLATIFHCGSLLEGILLGVAIQSPKEFNQADNAPKDREGRVKQFQEWTLANFIDVAHGLGFLRLDVKKFSHELRDFRNYIHPYQQMGSNFYPDKHTAEICLQVLNAAIASLGGER